MKDLRGKTIRGGLARMLAQVVNFWLRLATLMILARLLDPDDFGLIGMVTAFTGALGLFRDFGLSSAAIQRATITEEQVSTLFWLNLLIGGCLGTVALAMGPAIAAFYREPRLNGITAVLALGFVFNSAGLQHASLLQREMRFTALAVINGLSLLVAGAVGIAAAIGGLGYWALVAMAVVAPAFTSGASWLVSGWIPGKPRRGTGVGSMIHFGGILTMNSLVQYASSNLDKVLVGRFLGVDALGIYGRAYQLVSIPVENLNAAAGEVAFSALSRIQDDPERWKSYFLKGYSLLLATTIPIAVGCAVTAGDLIHVLLGPKWIAAVPVFRSLAPLILALTIISPLGWLIYSLGMPARGLKMALVIAPLLIAGFALGLPFGPVGVAIAYSAVMTLWIVPVIAWAVRGTNLSTMEVLRTVSSLLGMGVVAGMAAFSVGLLCDALTPLARLVIQLTVLVIAYGALLYFASGQRSLYVEILRSLKFWGSETKEV
jgi:PST family polysaccharide transporter